MLKRSDSAFERAIALDPDLTSAAGELIVNRIDEGEIGNAYAEAAALVKRRPQNAWAHFALSYVLRYAGFLEDAARECDTALVLDRNYQFRSCSVVFVQMGQPLNAMEFIRLDPGSEWVSRATAIVLMGQGNLAGARQSVERTPDAQSQEVRDLVQPCLSPQQTSQLEQAARKLEADALARTDTEVRYNYGAMLSYCGQKDAALRLLRSAIKQNYCAYTALQTDPLLVELRGTAEFSELQAAAKECQNRFSAQQDQIPQ
jgi:Tfp pilus assembly protein PilF